MVLAFPPVGPEHFFYVVRRYTNTAVHMATRGKWSHANDEGRGVVAAAPLLWHGGGIGGVLGLYKLGSE
jgi:hypothetical protein